MRANTTLGVKSTDTKLYLDTVFYFPGSGTQLSFVDFLKKDAFIDS